VIVRHAGVDGGALTFGGVMDAAGAEDETGTATAAATAAPVAAKTGQVLDSPIMGKVPFSRAPRTPTVRQLRQRLRRFAGYAGVPGAARPLPRQIRLMTAEEGGCGRCAAARHPAKPPSNA
jgi:hypothetical protein